MDHWKAWGWKKQTGDDLVDLADNAFVFDES
jgi:hypothetical protein